jgi:hypothetical protein
VGPRICRPPATSVKDSSTSWSRDWNNVIVSDLESPVYLCTLISDLHRPISATHVYSVHGWHVSHCRIERLRYRDTTLEPWNTLEMSPLFVISEIAPKKGTMHKERRSHAAEVSSGHWPSTGSTGTTARLGRRHWYAGVDSLDGGAPWLVFSVRNNHRCLAVSVDSAVSILIAIEPFKYE